MTVETAYLTVDQFAERFNISRSTTERAIRSDDPPPFARIMGARLISIEAADAWFDRRVAATGAVPRPKPMSGKRKQGVAA